VVTIGRNEGERLRSCLDGLPEGQRAVYVDSASTDGSVALARARGVDVVELDLSIPFTAARARNAGLRRLRERWPDLRLVQFLDGDCVLDPGWLPAAAAALEADEGLAAVCGRRREIRPDASIYNRLCDMEWNTPVGDALACGGDALVRVAALDQVEGYRDGLIAGEEPDLCARLRARGWRIRRLDVEMTLHDAAMTGLGQWWRRTVRGGHAFAELEALHPGTYARENRSILAWGVALPLLVALGVALAGPIALALLLAYPLQAVRIMRHRLGRSDPLHHAALYGAFCVLGKLPEAAGGLKYRWNRKRGRRSLLIEYK
jgi:GT2 family glycosyltransferase